MSHNQKTVKNYIAGADVAARRIVKFSADRTVVQSTAETDASIGISTEVAAVSGGRCDVVRDGITELELGGTVARGTPVTSDASGKGVAISTTNVGGLTKTMIGFAEISGVTGDIIEVKLAPSLI